MIDERFGDHFNKAYQKLPMIKIEPHYKNEVMKKTLLKCISVIILLSVFLNQVYSQQNNMSKGSEKDDAEWFYDNQNRDPGTWKAVIDKGKVYFNISGYHWNSSRVFLLSELGSLTTGKESQFTIRREAGILHLKGIFEGKKGHGSYKFEESTSFMSYLRGQGFKDLPSELMIQIFFTDINRNYFEYLRTNGYDLVSNEQLKDLAEQSVTYKVLQDYFNLFKLEGLANISLNKVIEFREHGVDTRFINGFHEMGYKKFSLDKALELRDHGVSPEFIMEFNQLDFKDISLDQAIELRDHGVDPDYILSIQKMGYTDISLDKAKDLRDHGVDADFIRDFHEIGYRNITLEKAEELKDQGVSAEYIKRMRKKGLNSLTLEEYIRLKESGM
jgi:hypothetical protein